MDKLEREGLEKFSASWDELVATVTVGSRVGADRRERHSLGAPTSEGAAMTTDIGFPAPDVFEAELTRMVDLHFASRIAQRDATIWGPDAAELAATRLGWTDLHTRAAGLIEQIDTLRDELAEDGVDRIVLAGMGGSSLGAEVIARAHGADLVVLDTTDPVDIAALCEGDDLERSAMVVATKSGTTIETVSAASAFAQALLAAGIEPRSRLIAVTDPETPMAEQALEEGWRRVFLTDPSVGGRYSALAAFGLVPAGLAGANVQQVVDEAAEVADAVRADDAENPALRIGALLTAAHARGVRTLALAATDESLAGLPDWLEQLVAESSGKDGVGILPVACDSVDAPGFEDAHAAHGARLPRPGSRDASADLRCGCVLRGATGLSAARLGDGDGTAVCGHRGRSLQPAGCRGRRRIVHATCCRPIRIRRMTPKKRATSSTAPSSPAP